MGHTGGGTGVTVPHSHAQAVRAAASAERTGWSSELDHCLTVVLDVRGPLDVAACQTGLNDVARRHPALRAAFPPGAAEHVVHDEVGDVPFEVHAVAGDTEADRIEQALRRAERESTHTFDVGSPPLLRCRVFSAEPDRHLVVLAVDQMAADGWSANLVADEFIAAADLVATGQPLPAGDPDDYVAVRRRRADWLAGQEGVDAVARRRRALAGVHRSWPVDPGPTDTTAAELTERYVHLPDECALALRSNARATGGSMFAVGAAALAAAFGPRDPASRVSIASTFVCRENSVEEAVVGWLSNVVALPVPAAGGPVHRFLREFRTEMVAAINDQKVPLELLDHERAGGLTFSLMYVPALVNGGDRAGGRIGSATVTRAAGSVCPTGADVDLVLLEDPAPEPGGRRSRLVVGGLAGTDRVGPDRLAEILAVWSEALRRLAELDWRQDSLDLGVLDGSRTAVVARPTGEVGALA